jgi:hypothetical protein
MGVKLHHVHEIFPERLAVVQMPDLTQAYLVTLG